MISELRDLVRKIKFRIKTFLFFCKKKKIKIDIGSGGIKSHKEWYSTDVDTLDITRRSDWTKLLWFLKIDNIMLDYNINQEGKCYIQKMPPP